MQRARILAVALLFSLPASAQQLVRWTAGPGVGAEYGKACLAIGDQNGDGFSDLLVGAPGFDSQRGAIYCVSGKYLALGTGVQALWSLAPSGSPGDRFGAALADVGDVTGDGLADFLIGAPGLDGPGTSIDGGAVRLVNGSTHAILSLIFDSNLGARFGSSIAVAGDLDGDGKKEVVVGAPGSSFVAVRALRGSQLATSADDASLSFFDLLNFGTPGLGTSLASGFDLNADGNPELLIGDPSWNSDAGRVRVFSLVSTTNYIHWFDVEFGVAGERFGASLAAAHDYDGDGRVDIVVGAPNAPGPNNTEIGRALVLSGVKVIAGFQPSSTVVYTLTIGLGGPVATTNHFGAAVRASSDLNGDGVGEILVGAPDYGTLFPFGPGKGAVAIFSGATGARLESVVGNNGDHLGDGLAGALDDLDGDGFPEFVVAGSLADTGGADSGLLRCYKLFPCPPAVFCTGKANSLGCTPQISFSGGASASSGAPFLITATSFLNQKNGLLFYSHQPLAAPFQGGTKCAANPTVRTPNQSSGGSANGNDCTGAYSFDFNDWIAHGWDPSLPAGSEVFAQYWSRDPANASHTSLSNALRFVVGP